VFVNHSEGFEAHNSRLDPGNWRKTKMAGKLKMKRCLLKGSQNKLAPLTDIENLLTGYTIAEPSLVMPKSWFSAGRIFCYSF
jgi:hypothetical protein